MLNGLFNEAGIDVLERTIQFAGGRHRLILNNIANISTPNFRPRDVDPKAFTHALAQAVGTRRSTHPGLRTARPIRPGDTAEIKYTEAGMTLKPNPKGEGLLLHDGSDGDLEGIMSDLAENTLVHRGATELLRSRYALLQTAIRERI